MSEYVVDVEVLQTGSLLEYVVPSFPVFKPLIREAKFRWKDIEDGTLHVFDGFVRECENLNHHLPAVARLPVSHDNAFLIEVSHQITRFLQALRGYDSVHTVYMINIYYSYKC